MEIREFKFSAVDDEGKGGMKKLKALMSGFGQMANTLVPECRVQPEEVDKTKVRDEKGWENIGLVIVDKYTNGNLIYKRLQQNIETKTVRLIDHTWDLP